MQSLFAVLCLHSTYHSQLKMLQNRNTYDCKGFAKQALLGPMSVSINVCHLTYVAASLQAKLEALHGENKLLSGQVQHLTSERAADAERIRKLEHDFSELKTVRSDLCNSQVSCKLAARCLAAAVCFCTLVTFCLIRV